jgi:hypothetical protein
VLLVHPEFLEILVDQYIVVDKEEGKEDMEDKADTNYSHHNLH